MGRYVMTLKPDDVILEIDSNECVFKEEDLIGEETKIRTRDPNNRCDSLSFELAEEQHEFVTSILDQVKKKDTYKYIETYGNMNSDGNALYALCCDAGLKK